MRRRPVRRHIAALSALSVLVIVLSACPNPFFDRVKEVVDAAKAPHVTLTVGSMPVGAGGLYDFGAVSVGSTANAVFTITNSGKSDLDLSGGSGGITLGGTNVDQFSLPVVPASTVISAGQSRSFTVAFTPTGGGIKSASVTIGSNDPSAAAYAISISGAGAAAQPVFTPSPGTYSTDQSVALTSPGAVIYYTIDGSVPNAGSPVYGLPISVAGDGTTITIKAYAVKSGMADSAVVSGTFTINANVVSTPNFSPLPGPFTADLFVTITSDVGATIHYTIGGSTPTAASPVYGGPIPVAGNNTVKTIKAMATKAGMTDSGVAQGTYFINYPVAAPPTPLPPPGTYTATQTVTLTSSAPFIVYTIDGSAPTTDGNGAITHGTPYAGPIPVTISTIIIAVAYGPGLTDSPAIVLPYTLAVLPPSFSPPGGSFSSDPNVTITCPTPGANIRYTLDGSIPSATVGIPITSGGSVLVPLNKTLRAIAYRAGWSDSPLAIGTYVGVEAPTISAPDGRVGWHQDVFMNIVTPGSLIAYTIDGTPPATNGAGVITNGTSIGSGVPFSPPFGTTVVRAIAYKAGLPDSLVVTRTYTKPMFLYVSSRGGGTAIAYSLDPTTGGLSEVGTGGIPAPPAGMAIDPAGRFLYLTDASSNQVWGFAIDPASGSLTMIGSQPTTSPGAISIAATGDVVYVANTLLGTVTSFTKDGAGILSDAGSIFTGSDPVSIATDPSVQFMYVASAADGNLSGYLLPGHLPSGYIAGTPMTLGGSPQDLLVDPTGSWLYMADPFFNYIEGFAIDPGTGGLTDIPGSPFVTSFFQPEKIAMDPGGKYLYVTGPASNTIELFQVSQVTGALLPVATYPTGVQPEGVRVDLTGKFVYVANAGDNTISLFALNPANGTLTPIGSPIPTPSGTPWDIQITGTP